MLPINPFDPCVRPEDTKWLVEQLTNTTKDYYRFLLIAKEGQPFQEVGSHQPPRSTPTSTPSDRTSRVPRRSAFTTTRTICASNMRIMCTKSSATVWSTTQGNGASARIGFMRGSLIS